MDSNVRLPSGWKTLLEKEFSKSYMLEIKNFLLEEYKTKIIYPKKTLIFNAFNQCDFHNVKVVIIGQDPYHGHNQAHGLSFSVEKEIPLPPSLLNIFKELEEDLNQKIDKKNGNLTKWTNQGVFLLNTTLTVEQNKPLSHSKIGWEIFTNEVIKILSKHKDNLVFILWGKFAQSKRNFIDRKKHLIISSPHPSPLSAYRGFFGSRPFSKTNDFFKRKNIDEIDWML